MTAPTANRPHYPALDGLRGLAILLVVFYHNFGFINYFFFGWLGVDLFFVLSGFLITDILLKTLQRPNYLKNFYAKRILRIFPLYYLILIIFLFLFPLLDVRGLELNYYVDHQLWFWFYLQNWLFIVNPPPINALALTHLWSLAVEEQFYLVWPFIILLIKKPRALFFIMFSLLLAVLATRYLVWAYHIENLAYFNLYTFSRIDGICIGSMLALIRKFNTGFLKKHTTLVVFTLAALNFLFYFFNRAYHFSFPFLAIIGYTTFAVMFALLVNEAVQGGNRIVELLFDNRILRFFGKISYGFYVFHWPVYMLMQPFFEDAFRSTSSSPAYSRIWASICCSIAGFLISVASYYLFEKHFLKLKRYFN